MLIDNTINTKWNAKTKNYYESLGYQYTKMGDSFSVNVKDLKNSSSENVLLQCDYCKNKFTIRWADRYRHIQNSKTNKDACNTCKNLKASESVYNLYGVSNIMDITGIQEKRDKTVIALFGVSNVFKNNEIKKKITATILEKYGVPSFTQTQKYIEKTKETCLNKYGETSHMKTSKYKQMFTGKNSPNWKGGKNDSRWDRLKPEYKNWKISVFQRDMYSCQKCLAKNTYIEAHHIFNWRDNPEKRYDKENGITFCKNCHVSFHRKYGKKNNDLNQLTEYLNQT